MRPRFLLDLDISRFLNLFLTFPSCFINVQKILYKNGNCFLNFEMLEKERDYSWIYSNCMEFHTLERNQQIILDILLTLITSQ